MHHPTSMGEAYWSKSIEVPLGFGNLCQWCPIIPTRPTALEAFTPALRQRVPARPIQSREAKEEWWQSMRIHVGVISSITSVYPRSVQAKTTKSYDFESTDPHWVYGSSTGSTLDSPRNIPTCNNCQLSGSRRGWPCKGYPLPPWIWVQSSTECHNVAHESRVPRWASWMGWHVQKCAQAWTPGMGADAPKPVFLCSTGSPIVSFIEQLGLNSAADSAACGTTLCMATGKGHQSVD